MTIDLVQLELEKNVDWETFEQISYELLVQDDLPRLRKIGGRGDFGADAEDTSFFENETRVESIVQITSDKAQVSNFNNTVNRMREAPRPLSQLIMVYRQPVTSATRLELQECALSLGITTDIRDSSYLLAQLGKRENGVFARYFGTIEEQVARLLFRDDPLTVASDSVYKAMLASLGAFVANPKARLTRDTLFNKAVLSAVVSSRKIAIDDLLVKTKGLFPEERDSIDLRRIQAAVETLVKNKECISDNVTVEPTESALSSVGSVLALSQSGYNGLICHVLNRVKDKHTVDYATQGYIERNTRFTMLEIVRMNGPVDVSSGKVLLDELDEISDLSCLTRSLPREVAKTLAVAIQEYGNDPDNSESLAMLLRSYAALAIRNIDPLGKRWQQSALGRSIMVLDTDAVLSALIDELPESKWIRASVEAFSKEGVRVVIPDVVMAEVVGHVSRPYKTYGRFYGRLNRMSAEAVDAQVWNVVVRGFYYAQRANNSQLWDLYLDKYYNRHKPMEYLEHLLSKRLRYESQTSIELSEKDFADVEEITRELLEDKEKTRKKAQFRDDDQMEERLQRDVRIAVELAKEVKNGTWKEAKGYLVSEDLAFKKFESSKAWNNRPSVHVFTRALPQLVGMICGRGIDDTALVELMFNPVTSAAATLIAEEMDELISAGVDLSKSPLERIEWDLREEMTKEIHREPEESGETEDEKRVLRMVRIARLAKDKGYAIDPVINTIVENYDSLVLDLEEERRLRIDAEEKSKEIEEKSKKQIKQVAQAAIGKTKRGRSRVARALEKSGISVEELLKQKREEIVEEDKKEDKGQ